MDRTSENESGFREDSLIYSSHPNPAWARTNWVSLDGDWRIRHRGREESIRVPFPVGSPASGVDFDDRGLFVYSREFEWPAARRDRRYFLHIGACDYEARVFINGSPVGEHRGGYASFSFDVSDSLKTGVNRLEVRVRDSRDPSQARGKQTFRKRPFYVWYAGTAGIWQSVWIEETGREYIAGATARGDFRGRMVEVAGRVAGGDAHEGAEAVVGAGRGEGMAAKLGVEIWDGSGASWRYEVERNAEGAFRLSIPFDDIGPRLWSPEAPNLYGIRYTLYSRGAAIDQVESYFGLREISAERRELKINGSPVFLRMVLLQGYYPGGVYAPLSYRRIEEDIEAIKRMGFNGARVHEKIESPYFHYLCDRLGLLITFELPSFYRPSAKAFRAYASELSEIIERDAMHPSSIMWILFNETWGLWGIYGKKSRTRKFAFEMLKLVRQRDPGRPVIDNSGWEHFDTDIVDFHHYLATSALARDLYLRLAARDRPTLAGFSIKRVLDFYLRDEVSRKTRSFFLGEAEAKAAEDKPWFLSEYGGFGWYATTEEGSIMEKLRTYTRDIVESRLFCGYCLTQIYDVGGEVNGLLTQDRQPKVDVEEMRRINSIA